MQELFELQRAIYSEVGTSIRQIAQNGSWLGVLAVLPLGVLFGAVHALTPGHSKAILATYVAGSPVGLLRAMLVSVTLSFMHVTMALLIAALSLPLVSRALGSVGRAPALENRSRSALVVIGVWMLWRALHSRHQHREEGGIVGFTAGLVPCPLTL